MSAAQYSIWFVAAVWLILTTTWAVSARWKVSRLQRKFDGLSEDIKGLFGGGATKIFERNKRAK